MGATLANGDLPWLIDLTIDGSSGGRILPGSACLVVWERIVCVEAYGGSISRKAWIGRAVRRQGLWFRQWCALRRRRFHFFGEGTLSAYLKNPIEGQAVVQVNVLLRTAVPSSERIGDEEGCRNFCPDTPVSCVLEHTCKDVARIPLPPACAILASLGSHSLWYLRSDQHLYIGLFLAHMQGRISWANGWYTSSQTGVASQGDQGVVGGRTCISNKVSSIDAYLWMRYQVHYLGEKLALASTVKGDGPTKYRSDCMNPFHLKSASIACPRGLWTWKSWLLRNPHGQPLSKALHNFRTCRSLGRTTWLTRPNTVRGLALLGHWNRNWSSAPVDPHCHARSTTRVPRRLNRWPRCGSLAFACA